MGTLFSAVREVYKLLPSLITRYHTVIKRISLSPGLPLAHIPPSIWAPIDPITDIRITDELPQKADAVIIGSGITGAVVAHTLLTRSEEFKTIVIVDSRSICGGASGRNGGHIKGETWGDYDHLEETYGVDSAQDIQRFRRTALHDLMAIDEQCCGGKGDVRNVETLDVFYTQEGWEESQEKLKIWREAMGEDGQRKSYTHELWEGIEAQNKWNVSSETLGVIWSKANVGLLNPYNLITSLYKFLTTHYATRLQIFPHTSVHAIDGPKSPKYPYTIHTSKGPILSPRIIHATNGHVSHFVPSLRSRIVPVRLSLAAARPGVKFLENLEPGTRSWCIYYTGLVYSFLSQLPQSPSQWGDGELLIGGGVSFAADDSFSELAITDESKVDPAVATYLSGALPLHFGQSNWGAESAPSSSSSSSTSFSDGRIKCLWSGIMGMSTDFQPWVGKLTPKLTPRKIIPEGGGEWVSAGFSGEGMVHAWGCGRSLGMMVLGLCDREGEELPGEFLITEDRVRKTGSVSQVISTFSEH